MGDGKARSEPLAITGIGAVTPLGDGGRRDARTLLAGLDAGRTGFTEIDLAGLPERIAGRPVSRWAALIDELDATPYIAARQARRLDRGSLFAVCAARQALADAGLGEVEDGGGEGGQGKGSAGSEIVKGRAAALTDDLGVLIGTCSAGSGPVTTFLETLFRQSPEVAPPFEFPNTVANAPASHVSIQLGLEGPNMTLSHNEAAIGQALIHGRLFLRHGRCERLLVGAVDEWGRYYQLGYAHLGALRAEPDRAATGPGGTLLGEGAVVAVLEPPQLAAERGAAPLAHLTGAAVASAAGEPYRWIPDAGVLAGAIRAALADAGRSPREVGSVLLGANGVTAMEAAELAALDAVFEGRKLLAGGLKGALGERAMSGAASLALAALARRRDSLPPYAGSPPAGIDEAACIELAEEPTPLPPGATLVVLYGVGGSYTALVVE